MDELTRQDTEKRPRQGIDGKNPYAEKFNGAETIREGNGNPLGSESSKTEAISAVQAPAKSHALLDWWHDIVGKKSYKRYLEREDRLRRAAGQIFLLGNVGFGLLYLWWFLSVINWSVWYVSLPFLAAEIAGLATATFFAIIIWYPRYHRPEGISWDQTPSVDVFITTCGEPSSVLQRTFDAVARIDYAKKEVYVLDDAASHDVRALAEQKGCHYIARADRTNAKAGNLNHGLSQTRGEFILTLDADQIPDRDIIKRLVNYFKFPHIGFVQSAQRFVLPEGDPFGNSDELFYRVMQPGKDNDNSAFSCGSGVIYRRTALESVGGFSTWNLVEDVHTSMKLHAQGWKSVYHDHPLTTGTAPADIYGVYKQRQQWATDSLRLLFWDSPFKRSRLTLKQKLQYFQIGFVYLASGFMMPIFFLIPSWSLLTGHFLTIAPVLDYVFYRGLYFLFTLVALVTLEYPADSRKPYKIWAGLFPIFMKATFTALRAKQNKPQYVVNKKLPDDPGLVQRFKAILPQLAIILLTIVAIAYGFGLDTLPRDLFLVNALWGCWVIWSLSGICSAAIKRKKFPTQLVPL